MCVNGTCLAETSISVAPETQCESFSDTFGESKCESYIFLMICTQFGPAKTSMLYILQKAFFRLCCCMKFETQKAHSTDCGIS